MFCTAYAVPSISELLVRTGQLIRPEVSDRRHADTKALLTEIYGHPADDERAISAFARLNYLHGHYIKQGKILKEDMLYTLALFMNKPVEWINTTEWRQLNRLEICAIAVFHKGMGDAMEIDFSCLPSAQQGWTDGLHFYEELDAWSKQYERRAMVPHPSNRTLTRDTLRLLLESVPTIFHAPIEGLAAAAMDDLLREALGIEAAPPTYQRGLEAFIWARRLLIRHAFLPRPRLFISRLENDDLGPEGHITFRAYTTRPLYVRPTLLNRWGPRAWTSRWMNAPLPGDKTMHPEGFKTEQVGPKNFAGHGSAEMDATKASLRTKWRRGCPFAVGTRQSIDTR